MKGALRDQVEKLTHELLRKLKTEKERFLSELNKADMLKDLLPRGLISFPGM